MDWWNLGIEWFSFETSCHKKITYWSYQNIPCTNSRVKPDDKFDETCIVARHGHRNSWIFWGSFYGSQKGPFLVWEKDWGSTGATSFCERILPLESNSLGKSKNSIHARQCTMSQSIFNDWGATWSWNNAHQMEILLSGTEPDRVIVKDLQN